MPKQHILIIYTGGTIAMVRHEQTQVLAPPDSPTQLLAAMPQLRALANIDMTVVSNIDSSDLQPELWPQIAQTIADTQGRYDGYVITHGTDTLAYTTAALALMIDCTKPIICTGSQRPLVGDCVSDAPMNLAHAVEAATLDLSEVGVVFGNKLLRGVRAHKLSEFHFEAFTSFDSALLGEFGIRTRLAHDRRVRLHGPMRLRATSFDSRVAWLPIYPGLSPDLIARLVDADVRGIYLQAYGAGNVPTLERSLVPAISRAIDSGVVVVLGTQCRVGGVECLYVTGQAALEAGAISAGDMTPEMTIVKLMWALGQSDHYDDVRDILESNIAGERTVDSLIYA